MRRIRLQLLRACGDGETYVAVWGAEAVATSTRGGPCNSAPVFSKPDYSFSIARNAPAGVRVGSVSSGDPDGEAVSYSISAGNADGRFAVATSTGRITVAGTLDSETASSYSLTVSAGDGNGGTATATVAVSVATSSACYMGTVVPNVSDSPVLARDCEILLSVRDTLAGTSTLNWSASTTISTWDGVTLRWDVDGVQTLYLTGRDLNGSIPAGLGELENLNRLDLDENRLTGEIPSELEELSNLNDLFVSSNSFTGCIPAGLRDVNEHDLAKLGLSYCASP